MTRVRTRFLTPPYLWALLSIFMKAVMVIDMQGLGMSVLRHMSTLKDMSKIATGNYPEIAGNIFLVNPPWGFQSKSMRPSHMVTKHPFACVCVCVCVCA